MREMKQYMKWFDRYGFDVELRYTVGKGWVAESYQTAPRDPGCNLFALTRNHKSVLDALHECRHEMMVSMEREQMLKGTVAH